MHCKSASPQGKQHKQALVHSLHCLNEENAPRTSRQGEGAQSQARSDGAGAFYCGAACTASGVLPYILGNLVNTRKKEDTHLEASVSLGKTACGRSEIEKS